MEITDAIFWLIPQWPSLERRSIEWNSVLDSQVVGRVFLNPLAANNVL